MPTINLGFTAGQLTSVDATAPWYASYYLNGTYELSTAEGPGHYTVTNLMQPGWWTAVDTQSFQQVYIAQEFLAFKDPIAAPETSTWLMLMLGFGLIAYKALDKRAKRARVRISG